MKKSISLLLSIALLLTTFTPSLASSQDDFYKQAGEILGNVKVLQGNASGDLMLNNYLNRQDMVVLVSRLFKEESVARNSSAKIPFKDVTNSFYKPYISWSVNKGLIVGKTETKFGFDETVTVQQLQTVLLRALGYNEEAKDWANVPTFASGLGIMDNIDVQPNDVLIRGLMASMTVNALRINKKGTNTTLAESLNLNIPSPFNVESAYTINRDTLKVEGIATGTNTLKLHIKPISKGITAGEKSVDVALQSDGRFSVEVKGLESGEYSYAFTNGSYYTKYENFNIKELPLELVDIKADNLKEIKLTFSKAIDKSTALFTSNYYTNAGNIKKVRLEDGDRQVVLTLADNSTMINQKKYNLSIYKIKSLNGEELSIKDEEFTVFDNAVPNVEKVKQLGNKMLKIYFSEPIKPARNSNFTIDGKRFSGSVRNEDNIVYLTFYTTLDEGMHTLTTNYIEDYVGYKSVEEAIPFEIIKDTEAPKLIEARATLEEVTLTFDEEIDTNTASRNNFYWKYGSLKRYPTQVKVSGEEVILDFSNNKLQANKKETIYVDGVADYSGNKLRYGEINVVPAVDLSTPEVVSIRVSDNGKEINVYYNKNVVANNRSFYTIKDKDNKLISIKDITGSGREYKIVLFQPLPVGTNTLTIQGVYDTTTLKNVIYPYTKTIDMKDLTPPRVISHSGKDRQITLQFSKIMDMSTITNPNNYLVKFGNFRMFLPQDTQFDTLSDGKMLMITLPETIEGKEVKVGTSGNLTEIQILGVKDISGNLIEPITLNFTSYTTMKGKAIDFYQTEPGYQAVYEDPNEIKIKFDQPIVDAKPDDFSIHGRTIYDVIVDGSEVITLRLDNSNSTEPPTLSIKNTNKMKTMIELDVQGGTINILDKVAPRVKDDNYHLRTNYSTIELTFTEKLQDELKSLFARDLIIIDPSGNVLSDSSYSTSLSRDYCTINIKINNKESGSYRIMIKDKPDFIMDKSGNRTESGGQSFYAD
ncbi:Ig-like domain-containing protein [Anaerosalibacter sp. Marseille-P3206]|uniref:Ig-like domain-containing protein n=1 Tax=Anaerosalibacter sp. Marseille-P3206 TaxID=1871005 RepID=UPI000986563E|nr:Ig-like domain-containing protein [Anaerosalibacter sp. Marseille-P3206]